jgi:hypothetical protein
MHNPCFEKFIWGCLSGLQGCMALSWNAFIFYVSSVPHTHRIFTHHSTNVLATTVSVEYNWLVGFGVSLLHNIFLLESA